MEQLFPEWRVWEQFAINEQQRALTLDALESSHPVEVEIQRSQQVGEIFDAISYSKGASAIHMLVAYLGLNVFRDGIRHYLQLHKAREKTLPCSARRVPPLS